MAILRGERPTKDVEGDLVAERVAGIYPFEFVRHLLLPSCGSVIILGETPRPCGGLPCWDFYRAVACHILIAILQVGSRGVPDISRDYICSRSLWTEAQCLFQRRNEQLGSSKPQAVVAFSPDHENRL